MFSYAVKEISQHKQNNQKITHTHTHSQLCGERDETINHIISECSKLADQTRLGRQGDPLGNVQESSIRPYEQMVYAQPSRCPRK